MHHDNLNLGPMLSMLHEEFFSRGRVLYLPAVEHPGQFPLICQADLHQHYVIVHDFAGATTKCNPGDVVVSSFLGFLLYRRSMGAGLEHVRSRLVPWLSFSDESM